MSIIIRLAEEKDFPSVLMLSKEMAVFQQVPEKVMNTVEQMIREQKFFGCFVAEKEEGGIVGMATWFFAYYTWVGKSLYLDDLYVQEAYRSQKIGSKLLQQIFELAKKEDCKRVRWLVSNWNTPALEFYKKCGAEIDEESFVCDFEGEAIQSFRLD